MSSTSPAISQPATSTEAINHDEIEISVFSVTSNLEGQYLLVLHYQTKEPIPGEQDNILIAAPRIFDKIEHAVAMGNKIVKIHKEAGITPDLNDPATYEDPQLEKNPLAWTRFLDLD